jgi:hypothetical protein
MQLVIEKPVTVITPTIGSPKLWDAIESVKAQTYACKHLIVLDGPDVKSDRLPWPHDGYEHCQIHQRTQARQVATSMVTVSMLPIHIYSIQITFYS